MYKCHSEENQCFNQLKQHIAEDQILNIFNTAVLIKKNREDQKFHRVYFYSKNTTETEKCYSS